MFWSMFVHTLRLALRQLRQRPSFSVSVIVTLTLALGAGTAIFSLVDAAYWRPLPFDDESRVQMLFQIQRDGTRTNASPANFLDWRAARSFQMLAAFASVEEVLSAFLERFDATVVEVNGVTENVIFKLPRALALETKQSA